MKNKNLLIVIIVVIVLALGVGAFLLLSPTKKELAPEGGEVQKTRLEITDVPLEERPFLTLSPINEGREIEMTVVNFGQAENVEYELTYLSEGFSRGAIGTIKLPDKPLIEKTLLLGSCSSGTCKYDKDVEGGQLTLRIKDEEGTKKLISDWQLYSDLETLASSDGIFEITASGFAKGTFIVASTLGLPEVIETGEVVAGPYGVFGNLTGIKTAEISFDAAGSTILAWDGESWQELETDSQSTSTTAETNVLGVYVVVNDTAAPAQ